MFLVRVLCSSVSFFLFAILLNGGFGSIQEKIQEISNADMNTSTNGREVDVTPSEEKNPFVYRRQDFNGSLEKIQTVDNGTVTKSTYIPIVPEELNLKVSDLRRDIYSEGLPALQKTLRKVGTIQSTNSSKENIVMKNGKKYKVIKVKKIVKNPADNQAKHQMQRRTFKPLQNLMSFLPLPKWMTRQWKKKTESETRSENVTEWTKLSPAVSSREEEENSKETLKSHVHNSEKIKKLLNLFTIVKFDNGECYANGMKGTCLHQVECEANGGKFVATCAEALGVCCYYEKTCGETSTDETTFFINEGFPESSVAAPKVCTLTLEKIGPEVQQLRLDFQIFELRQPTNGTCLHDRLVLSGQDMNDVVPEICGSNTGQHLYVDVEDSNGPFNLNVVAIGEYYPRNFRIKVTQVKRGDELIAPKNCLQYHAEPVGYVHSFNYQEDVNENLPEIENGYFNNLNYAICIKKQKGFCSVSYENEEIYGPHPTFHLVNVDEDGASLLPPQQAGAETFDCPDDYIIINGIRLCGEKLNDASIDIDYTRNYPVTDTTNGPFIVYVRTDASVSGRGFNLKYTQHPCLN